MEHKLGADFWYYRLGALVDGLMLNSLLMGFTVWILQSYEKASLIAILVVPATFVQIVFNAVFAPFADRFDRKKMMLVGCLACLTPCLILFFCIMGNSFNILVLSCFYAVYMFFNCIYTSAETAILPHLVSKEQITQAQSSIEAVKAIEGVVGTMLGAGMAATFSIEWLLIMVMAGKLLNTLAVSLIRSDFSPENELNIQYTFKQWSSDFVFGFKFVAKNVVLKQLCVFISILSLFFAPVIIIAEIITIKDLGLTAIHLGYITSSLMVGVIVGSIITNIYSKYWNKPLWISICCALISIALLALYFANSFVILVFVYFTVGILQNMINIPLLSQLNSSIPENIRARVMTLIYTLCQVSGPVGIVIFTWLADLISANATFLVMGLGILVISPATLMLKSLNRFLTVDIFYVNTWFKRVQKSSQGSV